MTVLLTHVDRDPGRGQPALVKVIDRPSIGELFQAHLGFVWRVLLSKGVAEGDLEDVTQEVFLTVHRRLEDWDPARASARTWIYAIAIRVAANHRRRAHVRLEEPRAEVEPEATTQPDPGERLDRARLLERLDAALEGLSEAKRDVFVLFEIEDVPMKEVAAIVDCPLQTAYARLHAARSEIKKALSRGRR